MTSIRAAAAVAVLTLFAAFAGDVRAQSLSIDNAEVAEGSGYAQPFLNSYDLTPFPFNVTLSAPSASIVRVQYATVAGTATQSFEGDYDGLSGTLTFAPGETLKTITVMVHADFLDEPTETFTVHLFGADNATIAQADGTGTILNDDAASTNADLGVTITSAPSTIHIGDTGTITFQIANHGPGDVTAVTWQINIWDGVTVEASQGEGCNHVVGGEGEGSTYCRLDTIASGANATVTMHVQRLSLFCPNSVQPFATVSSPTNSDPNAANDKMYVDLNTWLNVQPIVTPSMPDIAAGSTQNVSVEVATYAGANETLQLTAADNCISVPATVNTPYVPNQPSISTIPVMALSAPCTTHISFTRQSCPSVTYSIPVTTHASASTISFTFDPASLTVTAGQTVHVHVTASPLSAAASFTLSALTRTIDVPSNVVIDPITGGDIAVNGLTGGALSLLITAPSGLGSASSVLSGLVLEASPIALSAVSAGSGSMSGGTLVRITGHGFMADCWPFFDGVAARGVTIEGSTSLVASTPRHAAGAVGVTLRCSGASEVALNNAFTYIAGDDPAPLITSVDPLAAAPGQQVTIHGVHFRTNDAITFGPAAGTSVSSAPDAHVALVPSLPPGSVSVNVTDVLGRMSTTGPIFTVLDNTPQITHISPTALPAGAELIIDGSGFRAPYTF
ncbi:MAG: IPT/TIG domain-containing protein, partial [Acidobacteria bacterium]|nr:IPT/TIG domain-containing protein [Acidobacteriota bacterium]